MTVGPELIIFDFDGVILESADIKTRAFARLFEHHPEHVDAVVDLHLQLAGVSRYEKFRLIYDDILERPLDDGEMERLGEEFSRLVLDEVLICPFVPGAREFLEQHHRRRGLYVASGTPERELRDIVSRRELDPFFRGVYGTPALKDEISRRVLADAGIERDNAVFIGDATADLEGARGAGISFVGRVPPGAGNPFEGEGVPVVEDLHELRRDWRRICARLRVSSRV
jgi:phosphoglycolate phosphatase-like HAD superfamily hydrolase